MIRASEPAREILQNTNICKIHGFVGPFTPGTNGAVRTQFTLSHAIPAAELPLRTELCTWPSKRVAIRFGPRSRERRMPRAPKRCLGTAPKFPCAVSELIQQNTDAERHELVVGVSVLSQRAASLASSTPTRIVRAQWQLTDGPLCADIVAKVKNRATRKISRKLIFGLLCRYVVFNAITEDHDQFWMKRYGPSRRRA
jgi:hypothetical protein